MCRRKAVGQMRLIEDTAMTFKTILSVAAVTGAMTFMANNAAADSQLRGSMTAVNNVASAITQESGYGRFKWAESDRSSGPAVNTADRGRTSSFKWAGRNAESGRKTASVDSQTSAHRWILRNDADQSAHRWILRNDASQNAHRWILRNDADQNAHRWILRNDAEQNAHRWILR